MLNLDVFRARAFRLALAFCLAVSAATAAAFGLIYLQVSRADVQGRGRGPGRRGGEKRRRQRGPAAAGAGAAPHPRHPPPGLCRAVRRQGRQNCSATCPRCRRFRSTDARMSCANSFCRTRAAASPRSSSPAVAPTAGSSCSGAACAKPTTCRRRCCRPWRSRSRRPFFSSSRSAPSSPVALSKRFEGIHGAIVSIMNGELHSRLPVASEGDDVDKVARAVNLMLDEIERLLDQLKSVGDNIAHDLRTPLMVARAKLDRALEEDAGILSTARDDAGRPRPDRQGVRHHRGDPARFRRRKGRPSETVQGLRPRRSLRRGGRVLSAARGVEVGRDDHRRRRARPRSRRRGPDARGDLEPRRQRGQVHARKAAACASRRRWSRGCRGSP